MKRCIISKVRAYEKMYEMLRDDHNVDVERYRFEENDEFELKGEKINIRTYKAYIGDGNNSGVVKNVLKSRPWWVLTKKPVAKSCDLIWTQWIK